MTDREKLIEAMAAAMYDCCSHTDCDLEARAALSAIEAAGYVLANRTALEGIAANRNTCASYMSHPPICARAAMAEEILKSAPASPVGQKEASND